MRLNVKVRPNSKETRITGKAGDVLLIDIAAPADKNKANLELLKFLKRHYKKTAKLVTGRTSREKTIELI